MIREEKLAVLACFRTSNGPGHDRSVQRGKSRSTEGSAFPWITDQAMISAVKALWERSEMGLQADVKLSQFTSKLWTTLDRCKPSRRSRHLNFQGSSAGMMMLKHPLQAVQQQPVAVARRVQLSYRCSPNAAFAGPEHVNVSPLACELQALVCELSGFQSDACKALMHEAEVLETVKALAQGDADKVKAYSGDPLVSLRSQLASLIDSQHWSSGRILIGPASPD